LASEAKYKQRRFRANTERRKTFSFQLPETQGQHLASTLLYMLKSFDVGKPPGVDRDFFIDNLLVRIHHIIVMIK
jgi:hypothetical protein